MTWIFLALRWCRGILKAIPWQAYAVLGTLAGLWLLWSAHTSAVSQARSDGVKAGKESATAQFVKAQGDALALDRAENRKVEIKQAETVNKGSQSYETKRSDLAGRYTAASLPGAPQAHPGSGGKAGVPGASTVPAKPNDTAHCDGFSFSLAREADENTLKLVELQSLVRELGMFKEPAK
jgi:hypothetical protein